MLKYVGKQGELIFLHDNKTNVLVEEYYSLYQGRCCTFKYSFHHFDFERVILAKMEESPLTENEHPFINYDFLDSKQNEMIQVCDVLVGLLAKLFQFLDGISYDIIETLKTGDNEKALINFAKINSLIERSDTFHKMMFQNINDMELIRDRALKLKSLAETVNL